MESVIDITQDDLLATNELCPNREQMSFVLGCLMGDSSIPNKGYRSYIKFAHSAKQKEWLELKHRVLGQLSSNEPQYQTKLIKSII